MIRNGLLCVLLLAAAAGAITIKNRSRDLEWLHRDLRGRLAELAQEQARLDVQWQEATRPQRIAVLAVDLLGMRPALAQDPHADLVIGQPASLEIWR